MNLGQNFNKKKASRLIEEDTWVNQYGEEINLHDIGEDYLLNIFNMLERKKKLGYTTVHGYSIDEWIDHIYKFYEAKHMKEITPKELAAMGYKLKNED